MPSPRRPIPDGVASLIRPFAIGIAVMTFLRTCFAAFLGMLLFLSGARAQDPIRFARMPDICPVFSPDGNQIAFSSNRHGSYDVFIVPVRGGKPKRLTFDSAADMVNGWSPDGQQILFTSTRSLAFPPSYELYTVPVDGGPV